MITVSSLKLPGALIPKIQYTNFDLQCLNHRMLPLTLLEISCPRPQASRCRVVGGEGCVVLHKEGKQEKVAFFRENH